MWKRGHAGNEVANWEVNAKIDSSVNKNLRKIINQNGLLLFATIFFWFLMEFLASMVHVMKIESVNFFRHKTKVKGSAVRS